MATIGQQLIDPESGWKRIESNSSAFQYSLPTFVFDSGASGGSYTVFPDGTNVQFRFYGTQLRIIGLITPTGGNVSVTIDGTLYPTYSLAGTETEKVLVFETTSLDSEVHDVTLFAEGTGNIDSIDIDSSGYVINNSTFDLTGTIIVNQLLNLPSTIQVKKTKDIFSSLKILNRNNIFCSFFIPYKNELISSISITPSGQMDGQVLVIAHKEYDIVSSISITNSKNLGSEINVYNDFVVENPGWGINIYGYQKRSQLYVYYREDLQCSITIKINNMMYAVIDVIPPPVYEIDCNAVEDSFIRQSIQTLNYGNYQTMQVGYSSDLNEVYRSLIKFDISNIPQNVGIKKATLKLYNSQLLSQMHKVVVYNVASTWSEQDVTWKNQPYVSGIISSNYVNQVGYVEFDVTSVVDDWYDNPDLNKGFEIRTLDESTGEFLKINSKENSSYQPMLAVQYEELTINSFGETTIESQLYVMNRKDLKSSIRIPSFDSAEFLKSQLFVHQPDVVVSYLIISNPELNSNINVRVKDYNNLISTVGVRVPWLNEINSKMISSKPNLLSKVYVKYYSDLNSTVTVRVSDDDSIDSQISVTIPNLMSNIMVPFIKYLISSIIVQARNKTEIESKITVSAPDKISTINVRCYDSIDSTIDVRRSNINELGSTISISRNFVKSSIRVKIYDDMNSSISVRRNGLTTLNSNLVISSPGIESEIQVFKNDNIETTILIRANENKDMVSDIWVPYSRNLSSKISVFNHNSLNSSIKINSQYLKTLIWVRSHNDIKFNITIRSLSISELETNLTVANNRDLESTINVRNSSDDHSYAFIL